MNTIIAITALSAGLCSISLGAEPVTRVPVDHDMTRAQALVRADRLFMQFDLNHDGYVTRSEAETLGPRLLLVRASTGRDTAPGIGGHTLRFLKRRFAGIDGVTKAQFESAFLAHFDEMDVNHDGVLTSAERLRAR